MTADEFDPEAPEEREIGSEMVDQSTGVGSVVAHLYRGEIDREVSWRERLDSTTNWAVTVIAGIVAYSFSSGDATHSILLVTMGIGVVFLLIEARRFRQYDIYRSRVRSMQENLFANALNPAAGIEQRDWRRQLSDDYRNPTTKMSFQNALAHRLRRVYLPLVGGLVLVWIFRLNGADEPLVRAASVSGVPGWLVLGMVLVGVACLVALAYWPGSRPISEVDEDIDHGDLDRTE